MRYLDVADDLRQRIADQGFGSGGALRSEGALATEYGVSRVTVRRALEVLRDEGLVTSRRGSGWFLALDPVRQALGRVTTVEAALAERGATPARHVLEFGFVAAPAPVATALGIADDEQALRARRLTLADGAPFALVTVWAAEPLGRHLSRADVEAATFYELLARQGVELGGVTQVVGADLAGPDDVELLGVERGSAVLVCHRWTRARDATTVLVSEHRYPAACTTFEIEFPALAPGALGEAPGLRLAAG